MLMLLMPPHRRRSMKASHCPPAASAAACQRPWQAQGRRQGRQELLAPGPWAHLQQPLQQLHLPNHLKLIYSATTWFMPMVSCT
jgi:hypothetical protein